MANSFFEFKQFVIRQDRCAMKVGTLACILGAYSHFPAPVSILDIGTGTGLLALMLAQRYPEAKIDAVEIDDEAYQQARENAALSPWGKNIYVHHEDIANFNIPRLVGYDLIVSNPPFFENHLKSPFKKLNLARHDDALNSTKLLEVVSEMLDENGRFFVLIPPDIAVAYIHKSPKHGLFPNTRLEIFNSSNLPCKAVILIYQRQKCVMKHEILCIWNQNGRYSEAFIRLLQAYYLHL